MSTAVTGMSQISKSSYYAKIIKTLKKYDISLENFKHNPIELFKVDYSFRNWVYSRFPNANSDFTWYGNKYNWAKVIPSELYGQIENENLNWSIQLQHNNDFDNDEDDLFLQANAETSVLPSTKKQETSSEQETSKSSENLPTDSTKSTNSVPEKSMSSASGQKRKDPPTDLSLKETDPKVAKNTEAGISNVASSIASNTTSKTTQAQPTGEGEVDQTKDQQLQTPSGNAHNQRGTVQGEAGNLKIQKQLERYGIVKVMSSFHKHIDKVFIFLLHDKELSNDLIEIMEETYENGAIFPHQIEYKEQTLYIVAWKLPFNIGFPKLLTVLGIRYSKTLIFTKNINDETNIEKTLEHAVLVRLKNDVKLFNLAETVERSQAEYEKYKTEPTKRKRVDRFN